MILRVPSTSITTSRIQNVLVSKGIKRYVVSGIVAQCGCCIFRIAHNFEFGVVLGIADDCVKKGIGDLDSDAVAGADESALHIGEQSLAIVDLWTVRDCGVI